MQAQLTLGDEKRSLTGFKTVNREKLKALSGEKLSQLAKTDELELTYTHLRSLNNFTEMLKRVAGHRARAPKAPPEEPKSAKPEAAADKSARAAHEDKPAPKSRAAKKKKAKPAAPKRTPKRASSRS